MLRSKVKRIVVTSSTASIITPSDKPVTLTERDWNTVAPKVVEEKGADAGPPTMYQASKVLAEKGMDYFRLFHEF